MATPSFADILTYGPAAWEVADQREREQLARERFPILLQLKALAGASAPPPGTAPGTLRDDSGLSVNLPAAPQFGPEQQAELDLVMQTLGLNARDLAASRESEARTQGLLEALPQLETAEQKANVVNKLDVSPIRMSAGVAYDRFNRDQPIVDESSAIEALADYRTQKAGETAARLKALSGVLEDEQTDPLLAADIANKRTVAKTDRIKVQRENGDIVYMDAIRQPDGTFRIVTPTAGAEPLRVPPASPGSAEKDARFFAEALNIPLKDAALLVKRSKLNLKTDSPENAWAKLVKSVSTMSYGRYARDPQKLYEKSAELWSVLQPGEPIPNRDILDALTGDPSIDIPAEAQFGASENGIPAVTQPAQSQAGQTGQAIQAQPGTPQPIATETPPVPGARRAPDGLWYVPDPSRPGKWLMVRP
jgi:hypothetical protein